MRPEYEFKEFRELPAPVLTLFLNITAADASRHPLVPPSLAWFEEQSAATAEALPAPERKAFERQADRIRRFLVGRHAHEHAVVVFAGPQTWKEISLQVSVENELQWGQPAIGQLVRLRCEYPAYGVIVLDHSEARFLAYRFGELAQLAETKFEIDRSAWKRKDQGHVMSEGIRKTRGSQRDVYERRLEAQYDRLCRRTADQALQFSLRYCLSGTFLVGPERLIREIHQNLASPFRDSVVLVSENLRRASLRALLQRLQPSFAAYKLHCEMSAVESLQEQARHGTITNPDETLAQLQEGKIYRLAVAQGFDPELQQCTVCATASRSADPVCSLCRGPRKKTTLRTLLARSLAAGDVRIDFVSGTAAELLMRSGGLGGWVRPARASAAD